MIHASMEKIGSFAKFSFIFKKGDTATLLFCEVMIWLLNATFFFFFNLDRRLLLKKTHNPHVHKRRNSYWYTNGRKWKFVIFSLHLSLRVVFFFFSQWTSPSARKRIIVEIFTCDPITFGEGAVDCCCCWWWCCCSCCSGCGCGVCSLFSDCANGCIWNLLSGCSCFTIKFFRSCSTTLFYQIDKNINRNNDSYLAAHIREDTNT